MEPCVHFAELDCSTFSTNSAVIHIDECTLCFAKATDNEGIDLCLHCFNGSCRVTSGHTSLHHLKTSHLRFINVRRILEETSTKNSELTKLAINSDGSVGRATSFKSEYTLRCEDCKMDFPLSSNFKGVINEIENSTTAFDAAKMEAWALSVKECKHAKETARSSPVKTIHALPGSCSLCDINSNLWLCLSCGEAGCGRAQYNGDKGAGHALQHYRVTGHSLVVKMGTLGQGDDLRQASVYCYHCDEETLVPTLSSVLQHMGLNLHTFQKTEKTIIQMNLQLNKNFELSQAFEKDLKMGEIDQQLRPPGLLNLGNSCYINSLLQALFSTKMLADLVPKGKGHIETCKQSPSECFVCQFAKVSSFLTEKKWRGQTGRPFMFKYLVGKGHPEFKTDRQQDVGEYFTHLKAFLSQVEDAFQKRLVSSFSFLSTTVLSCGTCNHFYTRDDQNFALNLKFTPEQLEAMTESTPDQPKIFSFKELIERGAYVGNEKIFCKTCQALRTFQIRLFLRSFPDVLVVVLQVMRISKSQAIKLHYDIQIEEDCHFEGLNFSGIELENSHKMSSDESHFNQAALKELMEMGFSSENCKKALLQAGNNFDLALNILLSTTPELSSDHCDERLGHLTTFCSDFGISSDVLKIALESYGNMSDEDIINMILLDPAMFEDIKHSVTKPYSLTAGIVHLGREINSGHYVSYGRRELGEAQKNWIYFNDDKVYKAEQTHVGRSYMLLFEKKG